MSLTPSMLCDCGSDLIESLQVTHDSLRAVYCIMILNTAYRILTLGSGECDCPVSHGLPSPTHSSFTAHTSTPVRSGVVGGWWLAEHYETQFGLSICIVTRIFPAVQIYMGVAAMEPINTLFDGIFITILTVRAHRKCR